MKWNRPEFDEYVSDYEQVLAAERRWLWKRRDIVERVGSNGLPKQGADESRQSEAKPGSDGDARDPTKDAVGLALSGGGIRSATFNLGLLQAMQRSGLLRFVDYLSTVSGGGYIGSSLTWFKAKQPNWPFPFGTRRRDHTGPSRQVLSWLREKGDYLAPGGGLGLWALASALIMGTLVNLVIIVPVFLLVFRLLTMPSALPGWFGGKYLSRLVWGIPASDGFTSVRVLGSVAAVCFVVVVLIVVFISGSHRCRDALIRRKLHGAAGSLLKVAAALLVIGTIPQVHALLSDWAERAMSAISLSGLLSILGTLPGRKGGNETRGARAFFLSLGLALLSYGLLLWFYQIMSGSADAGVPLLLWWGLGTSLILAVVSSLNQVSMHRYYRDRLMDAYMPERIEWVPTEEWRALRRMEEESRGKVGSRSKEPFWNTSYAESGDANCFRLAELRWPTTDAPYHIINTTMNVTDSDRPESQGRAGENFIFSPLFYGAESTGFLSTASAEGTGMDLATALAISGAAVDPNTFATRSRPLSFLMALLNLRLGYWIRNPRWSAARRWPRFVDRVNAAFGKLPEPLEFKVPKQPKLPLGITLLTALSKYFDWYVFMFREMSGKGLDETRAHVHLADGGHFENLGLYELVRRRCRYIVVSDAGADPNWTFKDLGRAIELVRLDFGAKVELDTSPMWPNEEDPLRRSKRAYATGTITYSDGETADLLFIKTGVIDEAEEDVYSYRRHDRVFPDQTTADQFFDERQFEAYRELGFQIGRSSFGRGLAGIEALFEYLERRRKAEEEAAGRPG